MQIRLFILLLGFFHAEVISENGTGDTIFIRMYVLSNPMLAVALPPSSGQK